MSRRNKNSVEIWRGKSLLTGDPIVVLLTGLRRSNNRKTGAMLQTYILHRDQDPIETIRQGRDDAICGSCPLRAQVPGTLKGRACYVNVGLGPLSVWRSWKSGTIEPSSITEIKTRIQDRKVRIGTYGDPAAVPARVWTALIRHTAGHTGYTHQWYLLGDQEYRSFLHASIESPQAALSARSRGWKIFQVVREGEESEALYGTLECASQKTAGKITCERCGLCQGSNQGASVWITAHGSGKKNLK